MGALAALLLALPRPALAAPSYTTRVDTPCKGCTLLTPPSERPAPLLVLLHGDEGNTSVVLPRWRRSAEARGHAVLALRCPRDEGCSSGSWWRWAGDPAWISRQIDAVAALSPIDRSRVFVAGWSGGASYLGLVARQLRGVTGLSLSGGGLPPRPGDCPPCQPPVYFLAGDRNPLHHLAVEARDGLAACKAPVRWELLAGKDHAGELAALNAARTDDILRWLEASAACGPVEAKADPSAAPSAPSAPSAPPAPSVPAPVPPAPLSGPGARGPSLLPSACGCSTAGRGARGGWWIALLGLWLLGRRRARL